MGIADHDALSGLDWRDERGVPVARVERLNGLVPIDRADGQRERVLIAEDWVLKTQESGPTEFCSVRDEYRLNRRARELGAPVAHPRGVVVETETEHEYLVEQRLREPSLDAVLWPIIAAQDAVPFEHTTRRLWPAYRRLLELVWIDLRLSGDLAFANVHDTPRGLTLSDAFLVERDHPWWWDCAALDPREWFCRRVLIAAATQAVADTQTRRPAWTPQEALHQAAEMLGAVFPLEGETLSAMRGELRPRPTGHKPRRPTPRQPG